VINMILDKLLLRLRDCPLNGIELLREINAGSIIRKHPYHPVQMPLRSLEALDDARMRFVDGGFHGDVGYSWERAMTMLGRGCRRLKGEAPCSS
jgi:hypothetical protein